MPSTSTCVVGASRPWRAAMRPGEHGVAQHGATPSPFGYARTGAIVEPREPAAGPISPELVLVDSDLAASARPALPDEPWPAPVRIELRRRRRRARFPVAGLLAIVVYAAFLGILGVSLLPTRERPTFAPENLTSQEVAPGMATRRGEPPRLKPARTLSWAPKEGAAYYQVSLLRNGRRFYQARTRTPWLTFPRNVRFVPGEYRWAVRPAIPGKSAVRLAEPIVDTTFRVDRG